MAGHSRTKDGVASLAYVPAIHVLESEPSQDEAAGTTAADIEREGLSPGCMHIRAASVGSRTAPDQLLTDIVKTGFTEYRQVDFQKKYAEFAEAIWRSGDMKDTRIGLTLVSAYLPDRRERAVQFVFDYLEKVTPPHESAVIRLVELLRSGISPQMAFPIIERFKSAIQSPEFHASWAGLVVDQKDAKLAAQVLNDPLFQQESVRAVDAVILYRLHKLLGDDAAGQLLNDAVDSALSSEDISQLRSLAEIFQEEGRIGELEVKMGGRLPPHIIEDILDSVRRRIRRAVPRFSSRYM